MVTAHSPTARFLPAYFIATLLGVVVAYGFLKYSLVPVLDAQTSARVSEEISDMRTYYRAAGTEGVRMAIEQRLAEREVHDAIYLLVDRERVPISGNLSAWPEGFALGTPADGVRVIRRSRGDDMPIGARGVELPDGHRLLVGYEMPARVALIDELPKALVASVVLVFVVGLVGAFTTARYYADRTERIVGTVQAVIQGDLSRRCEVLGRDDDIDRLAQSLNSLVARVEELTSAMRVVTDGVAHDFRSPLTRLRARLDTVLQSGGTASGEAITEALADADALLRSLNGIIEIARAEAGLGRGQMSPVDLCGIARNVCELYQPLAEEQALVVRLDTLGEITVDGHSELIAQAVSNLIENAIKYSADGGEIVVSVGRGLSGPFLSVADRGPGIAADQRDRVLERFTRAVPENAAPGMGLGLSIVAAIAKLHDATFSLRDNEPGVRAVLQFRPQGWK